MFQPLQARVPGPGAHRALTVVRKKLYSEEAVAVGIPSLVPQQLMG